MEVIWVFNETYIYTNIINRIFIFVNHSLIMSNTFLDLKDKKILQFNLKKLPFEVMVTGEKNIEYRDIKPWTNSRLLNKDGSIRHYDYVKFTLGHGGTNPYFICEFKGIEKVGNVHVCYSNGFEINFDNERWGIKLGNVIIKGWIKSAGVNMN